MDNFWEILGPPEGSSPPRKRTKEEIVLKNRDLRGGPKSQVIDKIDFPNSRLSSDRYGAISIAKATEKRPNADKRTFSDHVIGLRVRHQNELSRIIPKRDLNPLEMLNMKELMAKNNAHKGLPQDYKHVDMTKREASDLEEAFNKLHGQSLQYRQERV
jgi:hypothetical protein